MSDSKEGRRYFGSLLLLIVPPALLLFVPLQESLATVVALSWVFLSIPVAILAVLDWFRTSRADSQEARLARHAIRVPIFLFGLCALLIGAAVLAWVAYNVFWQRQPEFRWGSLGLMFTFMGFGWYLINLAVRTKPVADGESSEEQGRSDGLPAPPNHN